jgi:hypothetical protein
MLAFGDPSITALNPRFPGLLEVSDASSEDTRSTCASSEDDVIVSLEKEERHVATSVSLEDPSSKMSPGLSGDNFAGMLQRCGVGLHARLNFDDETGPEDYGQAFQSAGTAVVRHTFTDGTIPPAEVAQDFVQDCQRHKQRSPSHLPAISVCCKAGLGRTGVMLGIYAAEFHKFPGTAFHGWVRMCRPGAVQTEMQQEYLRKLGPAQKTCGRGAVGTLLSKVGCGRAFNSRDMIMSI